MPFQRTGWDIIDRSRKLGDAKPPSDVPKSQKRGKVSFQSTNLRFFELPPKKTFEMITGQTRAELLKENERNEMVARMTAQKRYIADLKRLDQDDGSAAQRYFIRALKQIQEQNIAEANEKQLTRDQKEAMLADGLSRLSSTIPGDALSATNSMAERSVASFLEGITPTPEREAGYMRLLAGLQKYGVEKPEPLMADDAFGDDFGGVMEGDREDAPSAFSGFTVGRTPIGEGGGGGAAQSAFAAIDEAALAAASVASLFDLAAAGMARDRLTASSAAAGGGANMLENVNNAIEDAVRAEQAVSFPDFISLMARSGYSKNSTKQKARQFYRKFHDTPASRYEIAQKLRDQALRTQR